MFSLVEMKVVCADIGLLRSQASIKHSLMGWLLRHSPSAGKTGVNHHIYFVVAVVVVLFDKVLLSSTQWL